MNPGIRAWVGGSLAAIAMVVAGGCVDLSPVDYAAPEGGVSDAGLSDAFNPDALTAACAECLSGTASCAPSYSACETDPACSKFAVCMTTVDCWAEDLSNLAMPPTCLSTCAIKAGVMSQNSTSAALIAPLFTCAEDPTRCKPACTGVSSDH